jgi:two-component system sensor histidine kinase YesM
MITFSIEWGGSMRFGRSLRFKFIVGFSMVMIPIILFIYYNNLYAIQVVREQVSLINSNHLSQNMEQNERVLQETSRYLNRLGDTDPDIISLYFIPFGSGDYTITKQRIMNKFTTDTSFYTLIDSFFLYNIREDDITIGNPDHYNDKITSIREMMPNAIMEDGRIQNPNWNIVKAGSSYGLVKITQINQDLYAGAWINMNSLNNSEKFVEMGEKGGSLILSSDGIPLSDTSLTSDQINLVSHYLNGLDKPYQIIKDPIDKQKYLLVGRKSTVSDAISIVLVPEERILLNLSFFQMAIKWTPVVALCILGIGLFFIRKILFKPMGTLISGMRKATRGDLNFQLDSNYSAEFDFVMKTFNQMISEIQHLKIDIYEEKLRTGEAEFKQLQMQINPHFYLNSLNIIYSLAGLKKHELVQKMAEHLADYFRFSIRTDRDFIYLHQEMEHIEHYLEIQKLRFPNKLLFKVSVPESLMTGLLPPLTIQPFVENAIIHGFKNRKKYFQIEIRVVSDLHNPDQFMNIIILDNGDGFPPELMGQLESGHYIDEDWQQHVGIWNVENRLRMKFGDKATLSFMNRPDGGAVVFIRIPIELDESLGGLNYA